MEQKTNRRNSIIDDESHETSELKGDYSNVLLLTFLYLLQGIPLGIALAVPILLQNRNVSYADQARFSFAFYPYTLKILWAPIVDFFYIKSFGRRKSWVVPSQFLIGAFLIYIGFNINDWLGDGKTQKPQMFILSSVFFSMWMLTATQDIAVDGWCLTMLQRRNVGYAGTCSSIGSTSGFFVGYSLFVIFDSEHLKKFGLSLSSFAIFWGIVFLTTTVLLAIFKNENVRIQISKENDFDYGVVKAYTMLWKILKIKPVLKYSLVILTARISFSASDDITRLKLVDRGVPKDSIAILAAAVLPFRLITQFISSRYTTGKYPMRFYIRAYPYRIFMTIVLAAFVYLTTFIIDGAGNEVPIYYYAVYLVVNMITQAPYEMTVISEASFMSRISDPKSGGSYMTLLNTIGNVGNIWARTFFLWLVDVITWKSCAYDHPSNATISLTHNDCANEIAKTECIECGGHCKIDIDGYYLEVAMNVIYGILWFHWGKKTLEYLQNLKREEWHVQPKSSRNDDKPELEMMPLEN